MPGPGPEVNRGPLLQLLAGRVNPAPALPASPAAGPGLGWPPARGPGPGGPERVRAAALRSSDDSLLTRPVGCEEGEVRARSGLAG